MIATIIATQTTVNKASYSEMQEYIFVVSHQLRIKPNTAKGFKKILRILNNSINNN